MCCCTYVICANQTSMTLFLAILYQKSAIFLQCTLFAVVLRLHVLDGKTVLIDMLGRKPRCLQS